jgi:hypothetical protein
MKNSSVKLLLSLCSGKSPIEKQNPDATIPRKLSQVSRRFQLPR